MSKIPSAGKLVLTFLAVFIHIVVIAQTQNPSKVILKNGDVITGKIIELKPGESVKIEITGNNIITIPYDEVQQLILDADEKVRQPESMSKPIKNKSSELKKFYFQMNAEAVLGVGAGKVYGLPAELPTVANDDVYGGLFTSFGVGYNKQWFAGLGFGFYGNKNEPNYSIPYVFDLRYRILKDKKFSPIVLGNVGAIYHEGSLGSFTFSDGIGLSIEPGEKLNLNVIFTHTYTRFMPGLSLQNDAIEDAFSNLYMNYLGIRLGVSIRI